MNKNKHVNLIAFFIAVVIFASCAATSHPNEKLIVGTWKPVKVEKIVDSVALKAAATQAGNSAQKQSKTGKPAGEGGASRKDATLDRLVQSEMRATMEIFANKTAIKNFPGKPLHATWKMKGQGTLIVAKNIENKMKFTIEILEISKVQIVVIEHAPVGDIKITYEKQQ
ncbi:MAG: hypothetical protein NT040_05955 [Bacteroidetes bacterium]|nr:hypothetical protein [Bacteroidota bacterium]